MNKKNLFLMIGMLLLSSWSFSSCSHGDLGKNLDSEMTNVQSEDSNEDIKTLGEIFDGEYILLEDRDASDPIGILHLEVGGNYYFEVIPDALVPEYLLNVNETRIFSNSFGEYEIDLDAGFTFSTSIKDIPDAIYIGNVYLYPESGMPRDAFVIYFTKSEIRLFTNQPTLYGWRFVKTISSP